jgi:predicted transposase YbfD/YdcC
LHESIVALCENTKPHDTCRTKDDNRRLRYEIRSVEVFLPGQALAGTEWSQHVAGVIRVHRETRKRSSSTGLWRESEETAHYIADFVPSAQDAAHAIRTHWGVENRLHYVRDGSFAEDASRIRINPGIFARLRSFAANILRFNGVENIANMRYRIAISGIDAFRSLRFM